jgi:diguanylate cyclase (GGDEF)-like protein
VANFNKGKLAFFQKAIELIKNKMSFKLHYIDKLTGLNNKNALERDKIHLMKAMIVGEMQNQRNKGTENTASLLYCDISNLKTVNDTYGHDVGDIGIKRISHALRSCLREGDYIARIYNGDEFVAFLPNCPKADAKHVVDRIHEKIAVSFDDIRDSYPVMANMSCDVGIADTSEISTPKSLDNKSVSDYYEKLKKLAEDRMYDEKKLMAGSISDEQKLMRLLSSDLRDSTRLGIDYGDDVAFEGMLRLRREARQKYLAEKDQAEKRIINR